MYKKKSAKPYEEDYNKIKPGYQPKRTPDAENFQSEGFTDVIKDDKKELRNKALDAQARYKIELDAQIQAKKGSGGPGQSQKVGYQGGPLTEVAYQQPSPKYAGGYQDDDDGGYSPSKQSSTKYDYKEKNLTEAERSRLEEQRRRKAEMKDTLDQQVLEKQRQKEVKKQMDEDHARRIAQDFESSRQEEFQKKQVAKDAKQDYAANLKQQIGANQAYKKTSLW